MSKRESMNSIEAVIHAQGLMFIYIGVGFLCRKLDITDNHIENKLTVALTNIIFPCTIFTAMINTLGTTILSDVLHAAVICVVLAAISYVAGTLFYSRMPEKKKPVLIYSVLSSNAGFVGIPILAAIYGDVGVLYAAIYMAIIRIFTWTLGLKLFDRSGNRALRKILMNPNNIAMALAVLFHSLNIRLPVIFSEVMEEMGEMATPLCMVMIGSVIANNFHWRNLISPVAYGYSALRLIGIPLLTLFVLRQLAVDPIITGSMVILVAAPAPIMSCVFATRYDADKELAALLVLVSTMLSLATQPIITYLCSL